VNPTGDFLEIRDELVHGRSACGFVTLAEDRRWVGGEGDELGQIGGHALAAISSDPDGGTEERLGRNGAKTGDSPRPYDLQFGIKPWPAGRYVYAFRSLVDASFSSRLVAKVLDDVGDVHTGAVDAGQLEPLVEDAPGWTDERMSLDVLTVSRLLADQHQANIPGSLAEDSLRGALPELAGAARLDRPTQLREGGPWRHRWCGVVGGRGHVISEFLPRP
jgi:hypothetical protein